ncbi:hypothetical protein [Deinococcus murrayi]|uniref:hypothetical protein n=1 Tax=Deinococcus murrayi TaxID=68910 RepID=UPI000487DF06|nr:hypothetical protein [Deinococcus murrayi]
MRLSLSTLLSVLYAGVTLALWLTWLGVFLMGGVALFSLPAGLVMMLVVLLLLPTAQGLGHLRAALRRARDFTPLDGEVARRVGEGGRWLLGAGLVTLPLGALALWLDPDNVQLTWTPGGVLSTLLALAVPLLLIGLSDWLDRGRRLRDHAREVV